MAKTAISAKAGTNDNAPSATVEYDFGENLKEAEDKFGDDVVFNRFKAAVTIDIQAMIRRNLVPSVDKDGKETSPAKSENEIRALVAEWKPGVSARKRLSAKDKAERALEELSAEDKKALIESLMAGGKGKKK